MKKVKKVEEAKIQVTEEQLTTINKQQEELAGLLRDIGYLETQKQALNHKYALVVKDVLGRLEHIVEVATQYEIDADSQVDGYDYLVKDVEDFKVDLEKEYGAVNINLEDGVCTPVEKESE